MLHKLPVGNIELPDNWEDQTTYQFVSPSEKLDMPLMSGRGVEIQATRISLAISRIDIPDDKPFDIKNQAAELRQAMPNFKTISTDPWPHPKYSSVPTLEFTFQLGPDWFVHQTQCYFETEDPKSYICLAMSCEAAKEAKFRPALEKVFKTFERPA